MSSQQIMDDIVRETMNEVHWDRQLVAIKGSRGVGKTTLIRQYIRRMYGINAGDALYCVMDSIYFITHSLLDLAERFYQMGGKHLFLDEIYKYPTWSKEIKEIIDLYPSLKIVFSGSSLIQILNADADLSRRVLSYTMEGLSFREFLRFYKGIDIPIYLLQIFCQIQMKFARKSILYADLKKCLKNISGLVIIRFMKVMKQSITVALKTSLISLSSRK